MEQYEIIGWPDIQAIMDVEGFDDNATLIEENDAMGIGSSTYLVDREWLELAVNHEDDEDEDDEEYDE